MLLSNYFFVCEKAGYFFNYCMKHEICSHEQTQVSLQDLLILIRIYVKLVNTKRQEWWPNGWCAG